MVKSHEWYASGRILRIGQYVMNDRNVVAYFLTQRVTQSVETGLYRVTHLATGGALGGRIP